MVDRPDGAASSDDATTEIKTFLIADIRGYTLFTQERGDEAAGKLAKRFAELAREGVESRGGSVIELRGDEALAVFGSPRQAIRAAVDLQARFVEETIADPSLPLPVGIGIDAGEAVAVEGGYRGGALNLAARLCGQAGPGEILASQEAVHMARKVEGVTYVDRGRVQMKGISEPVHVVRVVAEEGDPATLLKPYVRAPTRRRSRRRPVVVALVSVLAVVAVLLPIILRGGGHETGFAPGMALLDAENGRSLAFIPRSVVKTPAEAIYADGHFWVLNLDPISFVEIEPKTGEVIAQIASPVDNVGYYAVDGNTLWVSAYEEPLLVKIAIDISREVGRFHLSQSPGDQGGSVGVVVADGSVWVARRTCEMLRLDPRTGDVQRRFENLCAPYAIAAGDGSVWTALGRIDTATNTVAISKASGNFSYCAAGGGFGWMADETKGDVVKVDADGNVVATYPTGQGARAVSYSNGVLWVGNQDVGTVTGIDGVTGQMRSYHFDHPLQSVAAGSGVVLVQLNEGATYEDRIDALRGLVAKLLVQPGQLEQLDPALQSNWLGFQVEYATCARLLRYADSGGANGATLQPEVAASMPHLSADGRKYTFTIRPGYRFSPPSDQKVTARTFAYSIERALSPKLGDPSAPPLGAQFIDDIEGEQAYRNGTTQGISGLRAKGNTLTITLTAPTPDFLARLALPYFCPVPTDTAFVPGGEARPIPGPAGEETVPSAGPYYVSDHFNGEYTILQRNPNYSGPRAHAFDAIALREGIDPGEAVARVEGGGWDGIVNLDDPTFDPAGALAERWGPASANASRGDQRYFPVPLPPGVDALAFNSGRAPFADPSIRRAAALALDRSALAAHFGESPSAQLLPPDQPGYQDAGDPYKSDGADLAKARELMHGRLVTATLASYANCDSCDQWAATVKSQLAVIGITVRIEQLADLATAIRKPGATFDLFNAYDTQDFADPATFLTTMFGQDVPDSWLPSSVRKELDRMSSLTGEARVAAAATLAARLATNELPATGFGYPVNGQFFSARVGCRVFPPFGYGIDLAAMCVNGPDRTGHLDAFRGRDDL